MRYILQLLPEHNANKGIVLICMMMMENTSLQKHYLTYYNYYQYTKLNIMHVMRRTWGGLFSLPFISVLQLSPIAPGRNRNIEFYANLFQSVSRQVILRGQSRHRGRPYFQIAFLPLQLDIIAHHPILKLDFFVQIYLHIIAHLLNYIYIKFNLSILDLKNNVNYIYIK